MLENLMIEINRLQYSLAVYHYVKVQQPDDICDIRRQEAKKMAKYGWDRVFGRGGGEVSEIKCIIFMVNNDNTYEIQNYN